MDTHTQDPQATNACGRQPARETRAVEGQQKQEERERGSQASRQTDKAAKKDRNRGPERTGKRKDRKRPEDGPEEDRIGNRCRIPGCRGVPGVQRGQGLLHVGVQQESRHGIEIQFFHVLQHVGPGLQARGGLADAHAGAAKQVVILVCHQCLQVSGRQESQVVHSLFQLNQGRSLVICSRPQQRVRELVLAHDAACVLCGRGLLLFRGLLPLSFPFLALALALLALSLPRRRRGLPRFIPLLVVALLPPAGHLCLQGERGFAGRDRDLLLWLELQMAAAGPSNSKRHRIYSRVTRQAYAQLEVSCSCVCAACFQFNALLLLYNSLHYCAFVCSQFFNIKGKAMIFSSRAQICIRKLCRDKRALHEEPLFPSPFFFDRCAAASRSNIVLRRRASHCARCLRSHLVHHGPPTRRSFQEHKGASEAISIACRT